MNNAPLPVPEHERKSKATGPRTKQGKARASLNAVRHGLAGRHILLPGEDGHEYGERLEQIFVALAPESELEAEVVVLVADDLWKLARLERMEKAALLGRIEELLSQTGSAESAKALTNSMQALADAITAWEMAPVPKDPTLEFSRRLGLIGRAVDLVSETASEIPRELIEACTDPLDRLRGLRGDRVVPMDAHAKLSQAARVLMARLLEEGDKVEAAQERLRAYIASLALPDREDLNKLAKYQATIELGLQRRLALLEQLRKLRTGAPPTQQAAERARNFRVRLRLVH